MRIIETRVFTFDELPEATQNKIIEYWDAPSYAWWESVYEDVKRVGVTIREVDNCRGTISLKCDYPADTAKKILEEHGEGCAIYILAKSFLDKITPLVEKLERVEDIDYRRVLQSKIEEEIQDLRDEFVYSLGEECLSLLRREYEWLTSREAIREKILSNEYEFTAEGILV